MTDIIENITENLGNNEKSPKTISPLRYSYLKLNCEKTTKEQKKEIKEYEAEVLARKIKTTTYFRRLQRFKYNFKVSTPILKDKFLERFKMINGFDFIEKGFEDIDVLIYYFSKDKKFFNCKNLRSDLSKPSFDKGLLIMGNYGNGKSAAMLVFQALFRHTPISFGKYRANRIVDAFESCDEAVERGGIITRLKIKDALFDDVKTEKEASIYGKHNLIKTILEEREIKGTDLKTYITCNYRSGGETKQDIRDGLVEFGEKYGPRVYDRLFKMFNIIQFNGKSYRL